jgi:hypothetical protein
VFSFTRVKIDHQHWIRIICDFGSSGLLARMDDQPTFIV